MRRMILVLALFSLLPARAAVAGVSVPDREIPEFHQVSDVIFRGGHPTAAGLRELATQGVRTVINLENDEAEMAQERDDAAAVGLTLVEKPMSMFFAPTDADADEILRLLNDPAAQPVFVHCTLGQDRTGLVVGLHRVLFERMDPGAAYAEMLENGFKNRLMVFLDRYYRMRTGFRGLLGN